MMELKLNRVNKRPPCNFVSFITGLFGFYVLFLDNSRGVLNLVIEVSLTASGFKNPKDIGKIGICPTTTEHNKTQTVCIIRGM